MTASASWRVYGASTVSTPSEVTTIVQFDRRRGLIIVWTPSASSTKCASSISPLPAPPPRAHTPPPPPHPPPRPGPAPAAGRAPRRGGGGAPRAADEQRWGSRGV